MALSNADRQARHRRRNRQALAAAKQRGVPLTLETILPESVRLLTDRFGGQPVGAAAFPSPPDKIGISISLAGPLPPPDDLWWRLLAPAITHLAARAAADCVSMLGWTWTTFMVKPPDGGAAELWVEVCLDPVALLEALAPENA